MTVTNELIDSPLADYKKPEDLIGEACRDPQEVREISFDPESRPCGIGVGQHCPILAL